MSYDRDYNRDYRRRRRRKHRDEFMADKLCQDCGSQIDLELHHLDPSQKDTHRIWDYSTERRQKEIAKCIVVCRTCHRKRHPEGWNGHWRQEQKVRRKTDPQPSPAHSDAE